MLIILICWDCFEIWMYESSIYSLAQLRILDMYMYLQVCWCPRQEEIFFFRARIWKEEATSCKYCSLSDPSFKRGVSNLIYWPLGLALWMRQPWRRLTKKNKELLWSKVSLKMLKEKLEQKGLFFATIFSEESLTIRIKFFPLYIRFGNNKQDSLKAKAS